MSIPANVGFAELQRSYRAQERAAFTVTSLSAFGTITGVTSDGLPSYIVPRRNGWPLGLSRFARGVLEVQRDRRRR